MQISEIGFGTWGLGGNTRGAVSYGPTDDRESLRALNRALELGITFYDTSDLYGYGHSERILGRAFSGRRDQIIIATKAGFLDKHGKQDFSPEYICRALEGSLKRLGTDYVDVFLLHDPPIELFEQCSEIVDSLGILRDEGKIRDWGISLRSPSDGLIAIAKVRPPVIETNFSLVDQRARQNGLLDLCVQQGAGVIVRTPLCFGFLTGQYGETDCLGPFDHRNRWSSEQRREWSRAVKVFRAGYWDTAAQTEAQFALNYCLSYDATCTAIPGMLTVAHVEENVAASNLSAIPHRTLRQMERIYEEHAFFRSEGNARR